MAIDTAVKCSKWDILGKPWRAEEEKHSHREETSMKPALKCNPQGRLTG